TKATKKKQKQKAASDDEEEEEVIVKDKKTSSRVVKTEPKTSSQGKATHKSARSKTRPNSPMDEDMEEEKKPEKKGSSRLVRINPDGTPKAKTTPRSSQKEELSRTPSAVSRPKKSSGTSVKTGKVASEPIELFTSEEEDVKPSIHKTTKVKMEVVVPPVPKTPTKSQPSPTKSHKDKTPLEDILKSRKNKTKSL
ncbi:hypothetical protein SCHPADRAFT_948439, partial [Schizopora paradoxa]